jgi:hypothetical protein
VPAPLGDVAFANAPAGAAATPAVNTPTPVDPTPPPARSELPAAYSAQLTVDVEAEVAAFRDKD